MNRSENIIQSPSRQRIRTYILGIFLLTWGGLLAELLLIEHTESPWQMVPVALLSIALPATIWIRLKETRVSILAFRGIMVLLLIAGCLGIWMHYLGNAEFELEMYTSLSGMELFWKSLKGATPALAPGALIGLGLLGWVYTLFISKNSEQSLTSS